MSPCLQHVSWLESFVEIFWYIGESLPHSQPKSQSFPEKPGYPIGWGLKVLLGRRRNIFGYGVLFAPTIMTGKELASWVYIALWKNLTEGLTGGGRKGKPALSIIYYPVKAGQWITGSIRRVLQSIISIRQQHAGQSLTWALGEYLSPRGGPKSHNLRWIQASLLDGKWKLTWCCTETVMVQFPICLIYWWKRNTPPIWQS